MLLGVHDAGWNVWSLDLATRKTRKLTPDGDNRSPSFSPDGRRIAYMRGGEGVWVMKADGTEQRQLTKRGHRDGTPAWSPDGKYIAYDHLERIGAKSIRMEVWVVSLDGQEDRRLTAQKSWTRESSWSPDGLTLIAQCQRRGSMEICVFSADGKTEADLTRTPDVTEAYPVWSPDGGHFAFVRGGGKKQSGLWLARADGTEARLVAAIQGRLRPPSWSPDGRKLLFFQTTDKKSALYVVARSGGKATRVANGVTCADWRPAQRNSKTLPGKSR
jgi:TolB protein